MSIDGPGILASDLAHDVYNELIDLFDAGVPVDDIRARISHYEDSFGDEIDEETYLAACAKMFWEIGELNPALVSRLSALIGSGRTLKLWAECADSSFVNERKAVLDRLLKQISIPRTKPRLRKKYSKVSTKLFSVGDCLELPTESKTYRGVVCKILVYRGTCDYAILVMSPKTKSTAASFAANDYYGHGVFTSSGSVAGPHVIRPDHRMLVKAGNPFRLVGRVDLDESKFMLGSFGGVLNMTDVIEDFERTETKSHLFQRQLLPLSNILRDAT